MSELKPCPFCGSEDVVRLSHNDRADIERCRNCNLSIIVPLGITMWNTRPIEDALNARITELKAVIDQLIEAGEKMFTAVIAAADPYDEGMREWDKIVNEWKE